MKQYKLVNNLVGWFAFVIAAFTYCMTIEPVSYTHLTLPTILRV